MIWIIQPRTLLHYFIPWLQAVNYLLILNKLNNKKHTLIPANSEGDALLERRQSGGSGILTAQLDEQKASSPLLWKCFCCPFESDFIWPWSGDSGKEKKNISIKIQYRKWFLWWTFLFGKNSLSITRANKTINPFQYLYFD